MNKFDELYNKIIKEAIGDVPEKISEINESTGNTITCEDGTVVEIEKGKTYTVIFKYRPRKQTEDEKYFKVRPPNPNKKHVLNELYLCYPQDDHIGHDTEDGMHDPINDRIYFDKCKPDHVQEREEKIIISVMTDEEWQTKLD